MTTADFKVNFSSVVDELKRVATTYGRGKKALATVVPQSKMKKPNFSVKPGDLKSSGWTYSLDDFEMTEEDLLSA